jgi:hypothetical protein
MPIVISIRRHRVQRLDIIPAAPASDTRIRLADRIVDNAALLPFNVAMISVKAPHCNLAVTLLREDGSQSVAERFCRPDNSEPMASTHGSLRILDLL